MMKYHVHQIEEDVERVDTDIQLESLLPPFPAVLTGSALNFGGYPAQLTPRTNGYSVRYGL